nr:MAG TPA: hypothetical protein [Caudoviricetes sp.]
MLLEPSHSSHPDGIIIPLHIAINPDGSCSISCGS